MPHYAAGLRFTMERDSSLLFAAAPRRSSTISCRKSEHRLPWGQCLLSRRRRSRPRERRGAGGKIFLALSRDNPLKTLDSKEQKKGKEDQKKGKESKTALSRTFHSLRKGFPTLPSGVARTK
jgi:hypothetical protein